MSGHFDPYHVWLGIPPEEQPPNHYRLLGIRLFETSPEVIDNAADQRMTHLRGFQGGRNGHLSQQLLNEVSAARICLLTCESKAHYDQQLQQSLGSPVWGASLPMQPPVAVLGAFPPAPNNPPAYHPPAFASPSLSLPRAASSSRHQNSWLIVGGTVGLGVTVLIALVAFSGGFRTRQTSAKQQSPTPPEYVPPLLPQPGPTPRSDQKPPQPVPAQPEPKKPDTSKGDVAPPEASAKETDKPSAQEASTPPNTPPSNPDDVPPPETAPTPTAPPKPKVTRPADRSFLIDLSSPLALPGAAVSPITEKSKVPEADQVEKGRERVQNIFESEFRASKTAVQRGALATKLASQAAETDDAADRYALLSEAGELAVKAGEVALALKTVDDLAAYFDLEPITAKGRLLSAASKQESASVSRAVAEAALELAESSLRLEKAEVTLAFSKIAGESARKARDPRLVTEVKKRDAELKVLTEKMPYIQAARAVLAENPEDAAANLVVGSWLCFDLEEWEDGLTFLAASAHPQWKDLADQEMSRSTSAKERLELADAWWEVAAKEDPALRTKLQAHAASWYRAASNGLAGLDKTRVDKRLNSMPGSKAKRPAVAKDASSSARPPKLRLLPICSRLEAKRAPDALTSEALPFNAPDGDGRRGANGFFIRSLDWSERGTAWFCEYRRAGTAWGVQFVHPFRDGHVLVTASAASLHVASIPRWGQRSYIPNEPGFDLQKSRDFAGNYFLNATPRKLLSYLSPEGDHRLYIDGQLLAEATIKKAVPFEVTSEFKGDNLPKSLPPGMAGMIIGPTDNDQNVATEIAFGAIALKSGR